MGNKRNSAQRTKRSVNHPDVEKQTQCYCPYYSKKKPISDENEKIAIYESLRNEIISTQGMKTNLIVYMFSVYFLIFGYGIGNGESHRLCFIATFPVLLAFQTKIFRLKYTIKRISVFISEFFEPETKDKLYKWETINLYNDFSRTNNCVFTFLSSTAALQLGVLSSVAFYASAYEANGKTHFWKWPDLCCDFILLGVCAVCVLLLLIICDEYKVGQNKIASMRDEFTNAKIEKPERTATDSNGS